ncbi:MAG: PEP-CTERM sorting domain-containing protein [Opitutales bacterium]|nr:PEP-CTERM sorting domain-containing protein [Opitutales bacterium]
MKKYITLAALLAAGTACANAATTLTELVSMDALVASATTNTATKIEDMSVTTYSFGDGTYIGGITNKDLNDALADSSKYITIAAWIKMDDTNDVESIFGYGAQQNGFKFCTNGAGLQYTAKGVADKETANVGLTANTWTLVGISFKGGNDAANGAKYICGTSNNNFYTRNLGGFALPSASDQTFAIGSGNSGSARETFNGWIADLTIFTSDSVISGVDDITAHMGTAAPVPEPSAFGMLAGLGALALVASRRRRK